MKKFLGIIWILMYASSSIAAHMHFYSCKGAAANCRVAVKEYKCCLRSPGVKQQKKEAGCCECTKRSGQNNYDQKPAEALRVSIQIFAAVALHTLFWFSATEAVFEVKEGAPGFLPPRNHGVAIYLLDECFLI